ncbi:MAG TPA: glycoside hydrolase family 44 protein [Polyangiaceae bacterium]|jgi:hypothetical protein|nr:glycoside hydrolase family 44 protein [Polyangiaceae bacterium]
MRRIYVSVGLGAALVLVSGLIWRAARRPPPTAVPSASALPSSNPPAPRQVAETIYDGAFATGWEDWGWGPHDLPKRGPAKIVFSGFGGIVIHHADLPARFGGLSFRYKPPADWPEFLMVSLKRTGSPASAFPQVVVESQHVTLLADGWREVFIPWESLDPSNLPLDRITIAARSAVSAEPILLDKIVLTKPAASAAAAPTPTRDVQLSVLCAGTSFPISPLIYGATGADLESGNSAQRIGGNPTTRLNWDAGNLWNTGSDWFFENGTSGSSVWEWIDGGVKNGLQTALTVPMIGWVAKDDRSVGFPTSKISGQRKHDPNRPEAGDGFRPDGSKIPPGPPTETSVAAPPEVIGRWIRTLREKDQARGKRSVQMYLLDNEPSLWSTTHRDVHPEPVGYDELLDRTIRYASEIRRADPEGLIAGPTEWGWNGYLYSGKDREAGIPAQPDRRAHGGVPLIPWYLQRLAEYEKAKGVRLLDVLDVHFYPAGDGIFGPNARTDAEGAERRLRATRALWDPDYLDESWIKDTIRLIPRLKQWVADSYPGRLVSIGEWNFGADGDISGGLATAEALGRFGQQGLDSAFFYTGPKVGTPVYWAFRAYRNFDGKGGRFLDVSLPTKEAERVSLFASRNDERTHLVAIIINKDATFAVNVRLNLDACGEINARRVFSYGTGSTSLSEEAASDTGSRIKVAPYSLAVVDLTVARAGAMH